MTQIPTEQIELIPIRRNYQGVAENITLDGLGDCSGYLVDSLTVLSAIHNWRYVRKYDFNSFKAYRFFLKL